MRRDHRRPLPPPRRERPLRLAEHIGRRRAGHAQVGVPGAVSLGEQRCIVATGAQCVGIDHRRDGRPRGEAAAQGDNMIVRRRHEDDADDDFPMVARQRDARRSAQGWRGCTASAPTSTSYAASARTSRLSTRWGRRRSPRQPFNRCRTQLAVRATRRQTTMRTRLGRRHFNRPHANRRRSCHTLARCSV